MGSCVEEGKIEGEGMDAFATLPKGKEQPTTCATTCLPTKLHNITIGDFI